MVENRPLPRSNSCCMGRLMGLSACSDKSYGPLLTDRPTNRPKVSQWRRCNQHVGHPGSCTETIQKRLRVSQSMLVLLWVFAAMRLGQLLLSGFTS